MIANEWIILSMSKHAFIHILLKFDYSTFLEIVRLDNLVNTYKGSIISGCSSDSS